MGNPNPPGVPGPVVPLPGRTTHEQIGDVTGGPVSPEEWHRASSGLQRLMIDGWISKACVAEGVDPSVWGPPFRTLIQRESGDFTNEPGDPNIVNLYDKNAQAGIPSLGFAQVVQPNAPGGNLLDPVTNIRASIRHIKETYGDIRKVQQADPNLPKKGYQQGGPVLNPVQELNFRMWAQDQGVQATNDMRRMWLNPIGFDTGGPVGDDVIIGPGHPDTGSSGTRRAQIPGMHDAHPGGEVEHFGKPRLDTGSPFQRIGFDTGGPVGGGDGGFTYPHPYDPGAGYPLPKKRGMDWTDEPGGGLDFLGENTFEKGVQNVMAAARGALDDPVIKKMGETWYKAAYDWVVYVLRATNSDMEIDRAIAICAALSRNTDWWTNMMRFLRYMQGTLKITGDPYAVGKTVYDEVKRLEDKQLTPDPMNSISGQKPHNFGWSIKRASEDVATPALIKPEEFGDPVAMDRWAKRIAMGVSDQPETKVGDKSLFDIVDAFQDKGDYPSPTGFGRWTKSFDSMADMYREAARRLGVSLSEVLQALTWVFEGPTKNDPTIQRFKETGEWHFPLTDEDIAQAVIDAVNENPFGFTLEPTGEAPKRGLAYAPRKETEKHLTPGRLSREDIVRYIRDHPEIWLKGKGGHIGGWLKNPDDPDLMQLVLDVSKVEVDESKWASAIGEAQKGWQESVYDLGRKRLLNLGYIDEVTGQYVPLGKPKDLLREHLEGKSPRVAVNPDDGTITREDGTTETPEPKKSPKSRKAPQPAAPEPEPESKSPSPRSELPKPPEPQPKPAPDVKPEVPKGFKPGKEKPLREGWGSGPGSARGIPKMGLGEIAGKVFGPGMFGTSEDQLTVGKDGKLYHGDGTPYQGALGETKKEGEDLATLPFMGESSGQEPQVDITKQPLPAHDSQGKPLPVGPGNTGSPLGPKVTPPPEPPVQLKPSTLPTPKPGPNVKPFWGLQIDTNVMVRHPSGPPTFYKLRQLGPNQYQSIDTIPVGPGDQIIINGKRVK